MNNEKIKIALRNLVHEKLPDDVHKIANDVSKQFKRDLAKTELNLWERIMNSPMTKYVAAAAVLIIVAFAGAQIFTPLGKNEIVEPAPKLSIKMPALVEAQQNTDSELDAGHQTAEPTQNQLAEELQDIKRMFATGDAGGLAAVLGDAGAEYENRIIAANFLAQIGDIEVIKTLEELSQQWQGDESENPFAAAIATIQRRQNKEIEPTPLADVPNEPIAVAETNEPGVTGAQETQDNITEKIDLKLNLQQGQKFGMKLTVDQKVTQTMMGRQQNVSQKIAFGSITEVLAVNANGIIALKNTYDHIQVRMDGPMGSIEYDSTKPPTNVNNPQAKKMVDMWSAMVGESFVIDVTPKGEIVGVQDFEQMWERMMEKLAGDDPNVAQAMKEMMKNFMSEEHLKQTGGDMMMQFLDEPVVVGDMWYDTTSINVGFPVDIDVTYILKDRKDGIAFIDVISKMDMGEHDGKLVEVEGVKINMQMSGTQTGTVEVDETTGWMLRCKVDQNFSGVIKMAPNKHMPNGMSIPMTIQGTNTVEPMEVE